jgi:hypothetical protein
MWHRRRAGARRDPRVAAVEPAADPRPFGVADTAVGLDVLREWCALPSQPELTAITAALHAGGEPGDTVLALPKVNLQVAGRPAVTT